MSGPVHFLTVGYIKMQIALEMNRRDVSEGLGVDNSSFVNDKVEVKVDGKEVTTQMGFSSKGVQEGELDVQNNEIAVPGKENANVDNTEVVIKKRYNSNIRDIFMNRMNILNSLKQKMKTNDVENKLHSEEMNNNLYVVLDLSQVTFLDNAGASVVRVVDDYVKNIGGELAVSGIEPRLAEVMDKSGVMDSMSVCVYPTFMDAIILK